MKRSVFFTLVCLVMILTGIRNTSMGQVILEENFTYAVGELLTANGWTAHSGAGTNAITVTAPSITYPGYLSSGIGNEVSLVASGEDDHKTFTPQTSGSVYAAFLVHITNASTTGDYFFHLGQTTIGSTFRGRVFVRKDASSNLAFGISFATTTAASIAYSGYNYAFNTTYLLVVKYTIVSGTSNDIVSMFINPALGGSEPLPTLTATDVTTDLTEVGSVALRQGTTANLTNLKLDGIRIGLTWADVAGGGVTPPTLQASNISFNGITSSGMNTTWSNGDGAKRIMIMNTANNFTNPVDGTDPTANPVYSGSGEQVIFNGSGNSVAVSGLSASVTYWFRVYEYNGTGTSTKFLTTTALLNPNSQATSPVLTTPTVTSPTSTGITAFSAMLGGNITDDGGSPITERGTLWKTTPGVVYPDNKVAEGGTATGIFTHLRGSLPAQTQIFFKAYANNAIGTSTSAEASFYTLSDEPTTHVGGFTAAPGGTTSINLSWTTAATGATGYLVLQKNGSVPPSGTPVNATGYSIGNTIGDGVVAAIISPASTLNAVIPGLSPATQYSYSIIPFAWDGINPETYNYHTTPVIPSASATTNGTGPATYTWIGPDNGDWNTAANWNPSRTTPAATDILQFNDGTTKTVTGVIAQTIGQLLLSNNTTINFQSSSAATLTISGVAGTDLSVPSGCSLNLNAVNAITIAIGTTATGEVAGNMTFSSTASTAHRLTAADAGSLVFSAGSVFKAGTFFSGNPFGTTSLGSVIFAGGSTFIQQAGSNPFGASQPNSVVVFQPGSLFKVIANLTPAFSGRSYANFEMDAPGITLSPSGGSPVSIDNLTITNGTMNFNMTGPTSGNHQIKGDVTVNGTLNFNPSSAGLVKLNGATTQAIGGTGTITTNSKSTLEVLNSNGINLSTSITLNGTLKLTTGLFNLGTSDLNLGTTGTFSGTPSETAMVVATGTGQVKKSFAAGFTGTFTYPVGDNTGIAEFSPVTLNFTGAVFGTANFIGVNLVNAKYPLDPNTGSYLNRYWNLTQNDLSGIQCNTTFGYVPADVSGTEAAISCVQVVPTPFTAYDLSNTTLHQLTANGLTAFGTFTGSQIAPTVITLPATGITPFTADLNGSVNANYQNATVTFEYGQTPAYGTTVPGVPATVSGSAAVPVQAPITGLLGNTTYHFRVVATNSAGTSYGNDETFTTGCPIPATAGTITGPANVCQSGSGYVYTVPAIANASTYNWTIPTGASITAGANTNMITMSFAPGALSGNITVYGSSICGNGAPSPGFAVTINPLPVPVITGPASPCINTSGNSYSTETGMTGYTWTLSAGGTITSGATTSNIVVTWTTAGPKTVSVSYTNTNGCIPATPTVYNVNVSAIPIPTIAGPAVVCASTTGVTYTTEAGMNNYQWNVAMGGTILSGAGTNQITVSWPYAGSRSVSVNYTNPSGCSAITPTVYPVTVNPAAIPVIGSSNTPCLGSSNNQYITNAGMNNYVWAVSPGGSITSGQGTNQIMVTWNTIGSQWVSVTYTNTYGCTPPAPTQYNLFVDPLPSAAGSVTGLSQVCAGTSGVAYSCPDINYATSYVWTLPAGATIATGAGTNHITVNFGAAATSGNITVMGSNSCGNGAPSPALAVTVNALPAAAGSITGSASVCAGSTGNIYTVPPIANATTYIWTVPAGAVITNGANTSQITVTFGSAAGAGLISVKGSNSCGAGNASPNCNVAIHAIPATPVVTAAGFVLTSSAPSGNQWYYNGTLIPGATGQNYTVVNNTGYYYCIVTLNGCSSEISNKVWIEVTGLEETTPVAFRIYPVPSDGAFKISLKTPGEISGIIRVYNSTGAMIFETGPLTIQDNMEKQIDLRPIADGIYSVVWISGDSRIVKKITVRK